MKEEQMIKNKLIEEGWILTDPSCNQYGKKISDSIYAFREDREIDPKTKEVEVFQSEIDLDDYHPEEIKDAINFFGYDCVEDVEEIYGEEYKWIIAECIFELESH